MSRYHHIKILHYGFVMRKTFCGLWFDGLDYQEENINSEICGVCSKSYKKSGYPAPIKLEKEGNK